MKYKYRYFFLFLLFFSFISLNSCEPVNKAEQELTITTTIFPLYDFTKAITKDRIKVELVLPPGAEPHSFEPKPRSIFSIRNSDLFIYTSDYFEIWATRIINVLDEDEVLVVNTSKGIDLEHEHDNGDHDHGTDPHIWIDPIIAKDIIENILTGIIKIDPENEAFYRTNAHLYQSELDKLDKAYQDLFSKVEHKTIIFGGHFVFGYLAKRYDIEYVSPYNGFSPDTLPTSKNIQNLIKLIKNTGQNTIFYEEMINPKVARVLTEETNTIMVPLNGAGNITYADYKSGKSYLDIMYENIEHLKKGLNYHE